jgi:hypothetical protein
MPQGVRVFFWIAICAVFFVKAAPAKASQGAKVEQEGQGLVTEEEKLNYRTQRAVAEDWDDVKLTGSHLKMRPPALGEIDKHEKFTSERIQVQWRPGDPIDLFIMKPAGVKKPPVIIYLASFPSETRRFMDDGFCERLTRSGFAAVGLVSAMTGDRFQNRPMKEWFVSNLREALVSTAHDVQMILNYLDSRNEFDLTKVGMIGNGSGATIAILAAGADTRIKAIDLIDPWADWPEWIAKSPVVPDKERSDYLKPEFLEDVQSLDPLATLPKLKTPHIRLQLIRGDAAATDPVLKKLEAAAPDSIVIEHSGNALIHSSKMSDGKLFEWLKDQLSPAPQEQVQQSSKAMHP